MQLSDKHYQYWNKNLRLCALLMSVWFVFTFLVIWFARELSALSFFGWPLSFYMAAQGSLIIYVVLVWYYAKKMNQLDHEYGVDE